MKLPEQVRQELVSGWLLKAEEDLSVAILLSGDVIQHPGAVGFHAQQAAEKYLKALLVEHNIQFPKTHDLVLLLDLVADIDVSFEESLEEIAELNPYGVDARYPADLPEVTEDEARKAISLARQVRDAVRRELKSIQ